MTPLAPSSNLVSCAPRAVFDVARAWLLAGRSAQVVEVQDTRGSVPREAGTRMLVAADDVAGTIGGGHLEWQAVALARQRLALVGGAPFEQALSLGPSLGQCCGGALRLRYAALSEHEMARWPVLQPGFFLQLYGAGHVGRAIARLLEGIDCTVQWVDEREAEFPAAPGAPHIERVCVEPVQAEVALAPPGAFFLVLTHSHDLDLAISEAILRRGDFGFFGLIGSKTKRARFEHRLAERGLAPALLERLVCPIGVPGITGKAPQVLAIAAVAQLLQCSENAALSPPGRQARPTGELHEQA